MNPDNPTNDDLSLVHSHSSPLYCYTKKNRPRIPHAQIIRLIVGPYDNLEEISLSSVRAHLSTLSNVHGVGAAMFAKAKNQLPRH